MLDFSECRFHVTVEACMTMEEESFDLNNFQIVPLDDDIAQSDFSNADELFPMNVSKTLHTAYSIAPRGLVKM